MAPPRVDWTAAGVWILAAAALGWMVWALWGILLPFILGAVVAYVLDPVVGALTRTTRFSRTAAVTLIFVLVALLLVLLVLLVSPIVAREVSDLVAAFPRYLDSAQQQLEVLKGSIIQLNANLGGSTDLLFELKNRVETTALTLGRFLAGQIAAFLTNLANIVLIPLIAFFLLKDKIAFLTGFQDLFPTAHQVTWERALRRIDRMLAAYFRGTAIVGVAITIVSLIGFTVIGMPYALLLSVIRGVGILIPYLGFVISIIPPLVLAALSSDPWMMILGTVILFAVTEVLQGFVLTPIIIGSAIELHELTVLFAILVGGTTLGLWGIILALPAAAIIKILATEALLVRQT